MTSMESKAQEKEEKWKTSFNAIKADHPEMTDIEIARTLIRVLALGGE
jgi:hypothetical protein